jgi:hypothetical protein
MSPSRLEFHRKRIPGMLSLHETAPDFHNPIPLPQDGCHYISVVFCRPAYPNLARLPRPVRGQGLSRVTLNQNGKEVQAFKWFSTTFGHGIYWYDWVALESLSPDFFCGSNSVGMIPDMWAANKQTTFTLKEMVESSTQESEESIDTLNTMDGMQTTPRYQ